MMNLKRKLTATINAIKAVDNEIYVKRYQQKRGNRLFERYKEALACDLFRCGKSYSMCYANFFMLHSATYSLWPEECDKYHIAIHKVCTKDAEHFRMTERFRIKDKMFIWIADESDEDKPFRFLDDQGVVVSYEWIISSKSNFNGKLYVVDTNLLDTPDRWDDYIDNLMIEWVNRERPVYVQK